MSSRIQINLKTLHPKQAMIGSDRSRFRVAACGRRFGKSELAKDVLINRALSGQRCWWLSPVYSQSTDLWHELEATLKPMAGWVDISIGERNIYFPNDGYIGVRSAHNPDVLRGTGLDFVVLDEAAFMQVKVWDKIVRPMLLERRGGALFLSTPYGLNWFYDLYVRGLDDTEPDWASWHFSSYDSPLINDEELEDIKRVTPTRIFEEEYLAEFKADGGSVFRGIEKVTTAKKCDPYKGRFHMGIDWGRDVDFTVVSVWDADRLTEVDIDRYNQVGWQMQRDRIVAMYEKWKPETMVAESNSIGAVNIEALQALGLPVRPFQTTGKSKPPLIEGLSLAIEQQKVTLLDDEMAKMELLSYQLTRLKSGGYSYDAPSGKHDDTVIARALAYSACSAPRFAMDWV